MPAFAVRPIPLAQTRTLRQAVLRPHQTVEELAAYEPADAFAVGAFDGEELVAVGLVSPEGGPGAWRVRDMATAPQARGRGVGTAVLGALLRHAAAQGATRIWCNARTSALSLYQRARFTIASDPFEVPDLGPQFVMELKVGASVGEP